MIFLLRCGLFLSPAEVWWWDITLHVLSKQCIGLLWIARLALLFNAGVSEMAAGNEFSPLFSLCSGFLWRRFVWHVHLAHSMWWTAANTFHHAAISRWVWTNWFIQLIFKATFSEGILDSIYLERKAQKKMGRFDVTTFSVVNISTTPIFRAT